MEIYDSKISSFTMPGQTLGIHDAKNDLIYLDLRLSVLSHISNSKNILNVSIESGGKMFTLKSNYG